MDIFEAKEKFRESYYLEEGFVGCGIGANGLRLYVSDESLPLAQRFKVSPVFEGFAVEVVTMGEIRAEAAGVAK